jgi:hypothetical protein
MWLRKEKGGTAIGPHEWPEDGAACDVPDDLARSLLRIPDGGYSVTDPPRPRRGRRDSGDSAGDEPEGPPEGGKPA